MSTSVNKKDIVIIPMFNESEKITDVIRGLQKNGQNNIIVVNDGSTDDSEALARNVGAYVVSHALNRGAGASIMTGVQAALLLDAKNIVTFDADGQHDPKDVNKLLNELNNNSIDVVLGYRDFTINTMPFFSKLANYVANIVTLFIFRIRVKDSQSGLRAYSAQSLRFIKFDFQGYEYCSALIGQLKKKNICYTEIPIATRYSMYSTTKGSRQNFRNGLKTLISLISMPKL